MRHAAPRGKPSRSIPRALRALVLAAATLASAAARAESPSAPRPAAKDLRVLLVGNSYTYVNAGIDRVLAKLAPGTKTARLAEAGHRLEQFASEGKLKAALAGAGYDVVVLQEQSQTPVLFTRNFRQGVLALDREIRSAGARTVLLMTWERPDSAAQGVTTANLAAAYKGVASEIGAMVAPAGLAFARSLRERPDIGLASDDGHPTPAGTYLAACVLHGTIFGQSPVRNAYADPNVPAEVRVHLQRVAAAILGDGSFAGIARPREPAPRDHAP